MTVSNHRKRNVYSGNLFVFLVLPVDAYPHFFMKYIQYPLQDGYYMYIY